MAANLAPCSITFTVHGTAAPQGSKRAYRNPHSGHIQQVENSHRVKPWREAVKHAALTVMDGKVRFTGPVSLQVTFVFRRPRSHYRTGRNADLLRDSAPRFPVSGGDIDKLIRATCDAITDSGLWLDDRQVVYVEATKEYAEEGPAGAVVWVSEA